jgi:soluble lytic murein transglycosylase-like protein
MESKADAQGEDLADIAGGVNLLYTFRRFWRQAAGLVAVVSVGWMLACTTSNGERVALVDGILQERASHLHSTARDRIARELIRAERKTGVDALMLLAMAEEESHFRPRAKSRRGALGLLQVRPGTARSVAERNRIPWEGAASLYEPPVNILIGATYLAELRERFGSWDLALTAYNQGPTAARKASKRGRSPSSRYAARVLRRLESWRQRNERCSQP